MLLYICEGVYLMINVMENRRLQKRLCISEANDGENMVITGSQ